MASNPSSSILKAANASVQSLFSDSNLTTTIQYKLFQGSTFSEPLGYSEEIYLTFTLTAIRTERKRFSIAAPGEMAAIAGVEINFLLQELPEGYSNRDLIQHNNVNHQIKKTTKIAELAYRLEVQGA